MEKTTLFKIGKISKIALAIGFGLVICGTAMGPAFAGGGHGRDNHQAQHHGGGGGHDRGHGGGGYAVAAPNYYYAPAPNYYTRRSRSTTPLGRYTVSQHRRTA